jgi:hypothetical protein
MFILSFKLNSCTWKMFWTQNIHSHTDINHFFLPIALIQSSLKPIFYNRLPIECFVKQAHKRRQRLWTQGIFFFFSNISVLFLFFASFSLVLLFFFLPRNSVYIYVYMCVLWSWWKWWCLFSCLHAYTHVCTMLLWYFIHFTQTHTHTCNHCKLLLLIHIAKVCFWEVVNWNK